MLPQKLSSAYLAKLLCDCNEWACHYHAVKGVLCIRQPTAYMVVLAAPPLWACPNHPNLLLMGLQPWGTILIIIYYPHVHIYQAYIFKVEKVKLKGKKKKKESPPFCPFGKILVLMFFSERINAKKVQVKRWINVKRLWVVLWIFL